MKLYHVTLVPNAKQILKNGFDPYEIRLENNPIFDNILDNIRGELPSRNNANYFWADMEKAKRTWNESMNKLRYWDYVILEIDATNIPCQCYAVDIEYAHNLFGIMHFSSLPIEKKIGKFKNKAKEYYDNMRMWNGEQNPDIEVLCPCYIPPEAIVKIHAPKSIREQIRLPSMGRGWHNDRYRHSLAARGVKTK